MAADKNARPIIIKKVEDDHGHGHHGGAWKVAYADFVTAMMAFFLLMWLLGSTTEDQRKGIADYFSPTVSFTTRSATSTGMLGGHSIIVEDGIAHSGVPRPALLTKPAGSDGGAGTGQPTREGTQEGCLFDEAAGRCMSGPEIEAMSAEVRAQRTERRLDQVLDQQLGKGTGRYEVARVGDRVYVRFPDVIAFPNGIALEERFKPVLDLLAAELTPTDTRLIITGHTDDLPIATAQFRSNWDLSTARAVTVADYLVNQAQFPPGRVAAQGVADTQPLVPNDTPDNRQRNRRVEIEVEMR